MKPCTKEEFDRVLKQYPLAVPDGFGVVGGFIQSRWKLEGKEIARESRDSHGQLYDIAEELPKKKRKSTRKHAT